MQEQQLSGYEVYKRLLTYVKQHLKIFFIAILGMIIAALADAGFVSMLKPIMDEGLIARNPVMAKWLPILLIGVFLVRGVGIFLDTYGMTWVARKTIFDLRSDIFSRLVHFPVKFYDNNSSSSLVSKLVYDVEQVAAASTSVIRVLVKDSLTVIALLSWMAYLNLKLTLILLILIPIVALIVRTASRRFRKNAHSIQASIRNIADVAKESFQGQKIVKTYSGQSHEIERFAGVNEKNRRYAMKKAVISAVNLSVILIVMGIAIAIVMHMAISPDNPQVLSAGGFVSYLTAITIMISPIKRLARINETLQAGIAGASSIFSTIDEPVESITGELKFEKSDGNIRFNNVSFQYNESSKDKVLNDISLDIEHGQTIALVGASGSGKSTIISLLLRFYEQYQGDITIDGISIKQINLKALRKNFSIVTQDAILFDDTLKNNITYGTTEPVDEHRLQQVCQAAHVTEFLQRLTDGLDTLIGERGTRLSGGQRQRIAIARAFYKNAPILILDEATSSLDTHSERLVHEATQALKQGRTTIMIAHRLSTIENADCIYVMNNGQIVEQGKIEKLLEINGYFASLWHAQQLNQRAN